MKLVLVGLASLALFGCQTQSQEPGQSASSESAAGSKDRSSPAPIVLTGRMLDESGAPVVGVKVELFTGSGTLFHRGTTKTDGEGRYSFEIEDAMSWRDEATNETIGLLWLRLEHASFASADGERMLQTDIPLRPGTVVVKDIPMTEAGALSAVLLHSTTGKPIKTDLRLFTGDRHAMHYLRYA